MVSVRSVEATTTKVASFVLILATMLILPSAQAQAPIPPSITTPNKVDTRLGTLDFNDGTPSADTVTRFTTTSTTRTLSRRL